VIYRDVWDQEHDTLFNDIHMKVSGYSESWLQSPPGIKYNDKLSTSMTEKRGKLPLVTAQDISELAEEGTTKTWKGIKWTVQEVFDIFSFLAVVAEVKTTEKTTPNVAPFTEQC
jgi:hypothetical protein